MLKKSHNWLACSHHESMIAYFKRQCLEILLHLSSLLPSPYSLDFTSLFRPLIFPPFPHSQQINFPYSSQRDRYHQIENFLNSPPRDLLICRYLHLPTPAHPSQLSLYVLFPKDFPELPIPTRLDFLGLHAHSAVYFLVMAFIIIIIV